MLSHPPHQPPHLPPHLPALYGSLIMCTLLPYCWLLASSILRVLKIPFSFSFISFFLTFFPFSHTLSFSLIHLLDRAIPPERQWTLRLVCISPVRLLFFAAPISTFVMGGTSCNVLPLRLPSLRACASWQDLAARGMCRPSVASFLGYRSLILSA